MSFIFWVVLMRITELFEWHTNQKNEWLLEVQISLN